VEQRGKTLFVSLQAAEARVLDLLAEVGRRWPVLHFEVTGARLEDVFVQALQQDE
jgi:hypothetical protein